ncbi:MAG: hypothetical protein EXS36_13420 [Pedosphaera sp.]|nr:hypothetical protein [Pedosphaera sp.]
MKLTSRDVRLLMFLPAILVLIIYFWVMTNKPMLQMRGLVKRINSTRAATPSASDIANQENRVVQLYTQFKITQQETDPLRAEVEQLMAPWINPARRGAASEVIAQLWGRHGMLLQEQTPLANAEGRLSPTLARLVQHARTAALSHHGPGLWEIKLNGGYLEMLSALQEIAASDLPSVPVSLEMSNTAQRERKHWKIALWQ